MGNTQQEGEQPQITVEIGDITLPDKTIWERPPTSAFGDPTPEPLYLSVGAALSAWEEMEFAFAALFRTFMHAERVAAGRVYGTILNSSTRRAMLVAASEVEFLQEEVTDAHTKIFKSLVDHWEKAGSRRNDIAHGCVQWWERNFRPRGYALMPAPYSSLRIDLGGAVDYRYTSADVRYFAARFGDLGGTAMSFYVGYSQKYGRDRPNA